MLAPIESIFRELSAVLRFYRRSREGKCGESHFPSSYDGCEMIGSAKYLRLGASERLRNGADECDVPRVPLKAGEDAVRRA